MVINTFQFKSRGSKLLEIVTNYKRQAFIISDKFNQLIKETQLKKKFGDICMDIQKHSVSMKDVQ